MTFDSLFKQSKHSFLVLLISSVVFISGCTEQKPYTFGFVGGLSGRISDLGGPARNGMLLAIEEANKNGGINGRLINSVIKDDKQDKEKARKSVHALIKEDVDVIMGPVTSSMAVSVIDIVNDAEKLMFGITVTTNALSGLDDYFIRGLAPTSDHANSLTHYLYHAKGFRNFSVIYDLKNKAYSEGWMMDFSRVFTSLGGKRIKALSFTSGDQSELLPLAKAITEENPELIIFVTNAVDAALLAKLVRSHMPNVQLATSEWAGTERLIELGGRFIEGAIIPQYHDRNSQSHHYQSFRSNFLARFNHEPGFPGVIAYNATNAVIEALKTKDDSTSLKEAILQIRSFEAIQGPMVIDEFGDAVSKTYITQIKNGKFQLQATP